MNRRLVVSDVTESDWSSSRSHVCVGSATMSLEGAQLCFPVFGLEDI